MKLCIDCAHHRAVGDHNHRCGNPAYAQMSPVTGLPLDSDCAIQRAAFSLPSCGPEGRGFVAKPKEEL